MKPETIIRHYFAGKLRYEDGTRMDMISVAECGTAHHRNNLLDCLKRYGKKPTKSKVESPPK